MLSYLLPGDGRGAEIGLGELVTQTLTEADSQSNIQNEIVGGQLSVVSGQLHGGVCEGAGLAGDQAVGAERKGDGDQTIRSKGRQCFSRSGECLRGSAGASDSPHQDASPKKRRLTERYWRRDRKQLRKLLAAIELERRKADKEQGDDAVTGKHTLESLAWRLPNVATVLGAFHPRSP